MLDSAIAEAVSNVYQKILISYKPWKISNIRRQPQKNNNNSFFFQKNIKTRHSQLGDFPWFSYAFPIVFPEQKCPHRGAELQTRCEILREILQLVTWKTTGTILTWE